MNEIKDGVWEWGHDSSEQGVQAHEVRGTRRVNAGHQDVSSWTDEKRSGGDGEEGAPCKMQ